LRGAARVKQAVGVTDEWRLESSGPVSPDMRSTPRIGVSLAPRGDLGVRDVLELAGLADELGYESLWIPESWGYDATTILGAVAARTSRLRLASGIFNVYSRTPALIAQIAATLQSMSSGRFILGLGTSGPQVVERWHGVPFRRPLGRTRECVEIVRLALSGGRVDYSGRDFTLSGFKLAAPTGPVPIFLAALGPANIRLTAQIADGWLPIFAARGGMEAMLQSFHASLSEAGRSRNEVDVAAYIPCLAGSSGPRLARAQIAYYIGGMGTFYHDFAYRMRFAREADAIATYWRAGDRDAAASAVSEDMLRACAILEGPEPLHDQLAAFRREGVQLSILTPPYGSSREAIASTLRVFAPR